MAEYFRWPRDSEGATAEPVPIGTKVIDGQPHHFYEVHDVYPLGWRPPEEFSQ